MFLNEKSFCMLLLTVMLAAKFARLLSYCCYVELVEDSKIGQQSVSVLVVSAFMRF